MTKSGAVDSELHGKRPPVLELEKMTTVEAQRVLPKVKAALLPVGSTEQHGANMTMNTDTRLAHEVAKAVAGRLYPELIVLPPIPVGVSYHHMDFAGSMTLSPSTLQAVVFDYIKSMSKHGIKRFIFVNGHGGNQTTLSVAATVARYELGVHVANLFYWNLAHQEIRAGVKSERYGHACEAECSFGLELAPEIVRMGELEPARMLDYPYRFSELERGARVDYPYSWKELTVDGSFGDARQASGEFGREMIALIVDRMEMFIRDFIEKEPNRRETAR